MPKRICGTEKTIKGGQCEVGEVKAGRLVGA